MKKYVSTIAVVFAAAIASAAQAGPITVYDGKEPKGTQIYLMPMKEREEARREYDRLYASNEEAGTEAVSAESLPAHVREAMNRPAPIVNGAKMGRYASAEALAQARGQQKKDSADDLVAFYRQVKKSAASRAAKKAPEEVTKGTRPMHTGEPRSPFSIEDCLGFAHRGVMGFHLMDERTIVIGQIGNQHMWVMMDPTWVHKIHFGSDKDGVPDDFKSFKRPGQKVQAIRLCRATITLKDSERVAEFLANDRIGDDTEEDLVLRQVKVIGAIRVRAAFKRDFFRGILSAGLRALGIYKIAHTQQGAWSEFYLSVPKGF